MNREMLCNVVLAFEGKVTDLRQILEIHGYKDTEDEKPLGIMETLVLLEMTLPHLHMACGVTDRVNLP
jgi:hypothetical protein